LASRGDSLPSGPAIDSGRRKADLSEDHGHEVLNLALPADDFGEADRREDNVESKVTEEYEAEVFVVVQGSPRKYG
jgi:hypothetical protein